MTYNRAIRMVHTSFESTFSELSNECLNAKYELLFVGVVA